MGRLHLLVIAQLDTCKSYGANYTELMKALDLKHPTITARLKELVYARKVLCLERKRITTPPNYYGHVYVLPKYFNDKVDTIKKDPASD